MGNPMPNCNHEEARHTDCCPPVPRFVEHKDGPCSDGRHLCHCNPCGQVHQPSCGQLTGRRMGSLRYGMKFPVNQRRRYLGFPSRLKVALPTSVPCTDWLRYNDPVLWQRQTFGLASVEGLQRIRYAYPRVSAWLRKHSKEISPDSAHFLNLGRMIVVLYDKTSSRNSVNEARMNLFSRRTGDIGYLPPTQVRKHK